MDVNITNILRSELLLQHLLLLPLEDHSIVPLIAKFGNYTIEFIRDEATHTLLKFNLFADGELILQANYSYDSHGELQSVEFTGVVTGKLIRRVVSTDDNTLGEQITITIDSVS